MINLLFFGSDDFPIPILERCIDIRRIRVVGLVTSPNAGEDDHLVILANERNIPVFKPKNFREEAKRILEETNPMINLVCNYGQILDAYTLRYPEKGSMNIHASLLPVLRGACPIEMAIMDGLKRTGITFQLMAEELDTGDILTQEGIDIHPDETGGTLRKKLQELSVEMVRTSIFGWYDENLLPKKQENENATYCARADISKKSAEIDWTESAKMIARKVRAFNPRPTAWTTIEFSGSRKRLKVFSTEVCEDCNCAEDVGIGCGDKEGGICKRTGEGCLQLVEVQLEGKKKMMMKDIENGIKGKYQLI